VGIPSGPATFFVGYECDRALLARLKRHPYVQVTRNGGETIDLGVRRLA